MKNISPEIARILAVPPSHLYSIRDQHSATLSKAQRCLENKHLVAWTPELNALVKSLSTQVADDEKAIERFELSIPPLERAHAEEVAAKQDLDRATHARGVGSMKRAEALRLRDDVEACDQILLIKRRATADAANVAKMGLPSTNMLPANPCRDEALAIATFCTNLKFHSEVSFASIPKETWDRWLEMPEHEFRWFPFHAADVIAKANEGAKAYAGDYRREPVVLPVDDFVAKLAQLKNARSAHIRAKVQNAQQELENARERAAALVGASS